MLSKGGFDFFPLNFDESGTLIDTAQLDDLKEHAAAATDAIFLAHGFRNDENDATALYTALLQNLHQQLELPEFQQTATRRYVVAGVYWPSKTFKETFATDKSFGTDSGSVQSVDDDVNATPLRQSLLQLNALKTLCPEHSGELDQAIALLPSIDGNRAAQDNFVNLVLHLLNGSELDETEGIDEIRNVRGSDLLDKLAAPIFLPTQRGASGSDSSGGVTAVDDFTTDGGGEGGVLSIGSFLGSIFGRVGQFLNATTWYVMKNRSGVVGGAGVAQCVRDLKASTPNLRIHLIGHSLGGRLMAACAKSLSQGTMVQPDSLALLEAAFSHYGFSGNNGQGTPGFFRDVITRQVVKGPLIETFSFQDTVVGTIYAVASRLAGDNVKAIGDADDPFGGIGRNGAQKTTESVSLPLKSAAAAGEPYKFQAGIVTCLDGSGGLITNHSDVTNAHVAYACASVIAATGAEAHQQSRSAPA